jgi:alanine racemase
MHLTINSAALRSNFTLLKSKIPATCQAAAVIKANAYGIGVDVAVPALEQAGAKFFYVATLDEALEVRKLTSLPIAMFGGLIKSAADDYKHHKIIPVLNSAEDIENCPADLPAIWHIDTGMNRLGLNTKDVASFASKATALPILMMTHFTSSDDVGSPFSSEQVRRFDACIAELPKPFQILPQSVCNSSGIFRDPSWHRGQIRPGIALYGGNPTPETENPMQNVVSLDARILQIREAKAGETVGYNQTETLTKDTSLATIGIGYADGFLRSGSGKASLYWHGQSCKIIGRVSMDAVVVNIGNLTNCPAPRQGDMIEVIGNHQSLDRLAEDLGTISYEILTGLSRRAVKTVKTH